MLGLGLTLAFSSFILNAQNTIHRFKLNKEAVPVGKVFFYNKSNIDGTHSSHTALYVKSASELESFKWNDGYPGGTLVKAWMSWKTFSVDKFETSRINQSGQEQVRAILSTDSKNSKALINIPGAFEGEMELPAWPWHSYDFDFASLSICWAHLKDKKTPIELAISDYKSDGQGGGSFAYIGQIEIEFEKKEKMNNRMCNKYKIDGPGLENRGGYIWMDANEHFLVEYQIDLPDEPGYNDGRLRLESIKEMTAEEWEQFKKRTASE